MKFRVETLHQVALLNTAAELLHTVFEPTLAAFVFIIIKHFEYLE